MLFLIVMISVLVPATYQQCLTADDSSPRTSQDARQALIHGQHEFSLSMMNTVNAQSQGSNIFFSPFSVYQAMLLAYFVSANQTEESLKRTLFLPESQDKLSTMQAYRLEKYFQKMRAVNGSSSYELSSANRLFVSPEQRIRECMQMLFNEEVESLDFASDPDAAASRINSWVAAITKNNIVDLIPAGQLSAATQLVLANAAYFKGLWKSKFLADNSRREVFHVNSSKKVLVTMMRQKGTFNHYSGDDGRGRLVQGRGGPERLDRSAGHPAERRRAQSQDPGGRGRYGGGRRHGSLHLQIVAPARPRHIHLQPPLRLSDIRQGVAERTVRGRVQLAPRTQQQCVVKVRT